MISATRFPAQAGSHTTSSAAARKNPHHLANPGELIMTLPRRFIAREPAYQNPAAGLVSQITNRDLDRQTMEPVTLVSAGRLGVRPLLSGFFGSRWPPEDRKSAGEVSDARRCL